MTSDQLWEETGEMLRRAQREEVSPEQARARLDAWLRQKASGQSPTDLSAETIRALGEENSTLPGEFCDLLGLQHGATYGDRRFQRDEQLARAMARFRS